MIPMLSIIIPTFGEAENIPLLVGRIRAAIEPNYVYEIVVVDDNSRDGTEACVNELQRCGVPIRLIVRTTERGLCSAILRGLREAKGDWLLNMDADMSHPPEAIPRMLQVLQEQQADLVVGSRYVAGGGVDKGWGCYRWANSLVALWLARPLTPVRDGGAGFFLLPRRVFEAGRNLNPIGYKMLLEVLVKCPCHKVVEVPIQFADRKFGQSKLNFREQILYLLHLKRLYDYKFPRATRLVQFCALGLFGVLVNLLLLAGFRMLGMSFDLAYALAIGLSQSWNFLPNRLLTFDLFVSHPLWPQYGRYMLHCLVGGAINWLTASQLVEQTAWYASHIYIAVLMGLLVGAPFNFWLAAPGRLTDQNGRLN